MTGTEADDNPLDNRAIIERVLGKSFAQLSPDRLQLVRDFASQIAAIHDPDAITTFMRWCSDARLDSLLHQASRLDSDALDQLLFFAEKLESDS